MLDLVLYFLVVLGGLLLLVFLLGYATKNRRKDEDYLDPILRLARAVLIMAAYGAGILYLVYGGWVVWNEFPKMDTRSIICITWFGLLVLVLTAIFCKFFLKNSQVTEISKQKIRTDVHEKMLLAHEERLKAMERKIDSRSGKKGSQKAQTDARAAGQAADKPETAPGSESSVEEEAGQADAAVLPEDVEPVADAEESGEAAGSGRNNLPRRGDRKKKQHR